MKIAQVVSVFPPYKSGIGNVAYDYAVISVKFGHNLTVLTPDYGQENKIKDTRFNIKYIKPTFRSGKGGLMIKLKPVLNDFDLVHLHYPFFGGAEIVWLDMLLNRDYKLIIHYHMDTLNLEISKKILSLPSLLIFNSLFNRADKITCASLDYIQESKLGKLYKQAPEKFVEIPFAVDTDKLKPFKDAEGEGGKTGILFIGGLDKAHYFKGLGILLEAFRELNNKDTELIIIGDGDLKRKYRAQAQALGIDGRVKFLGEVSEEEKIRNLQIADLLVLPSINRHEAFGIVLLEAMATGTPVIASDLPGVRTVFKNYEHGMLIKPGDKDDLVKKLNIIIGDKLFIGFAGKKARDYACEQYSIKKMEQKLIALYESMHY